MGYAERFGELIASGADIDGEARLADALVPRKARILDAGAGMGRVAHALQVRGHDVTAVEKDPALVADAQRRYPDLNVVESDILGVSPALVGEKGFDLVVVVGNVMILLAEDTERRALAALASVLTESGRILLGFSLHSGPGRSRVYPYDEFAADAASVGLSVQHRFGTYELHAPNDDYAVIVLQQARASSGILPDVRPA